jgi:hypothetical protein
LAMFSIFAGLVSCRNKGWHYPWWVEIHHQPLEWCHNHQVCQAWVDWPMGCVVCFLYYGCSQEEQEMAVNRNDFTWPTYLKIVF